ncbi:T9SS type A sorting domain-containing protein, partial [candidate division KSB1 bacterium]|nr:T9SS type A sorting domain-containing protein [candidate division KSB1 bacterium]
DDRIESNKYYYYRLEDVDINGQAKQHGPINIFIDPALMAPTEYSLDQNYPNPFNPGTTISYGLPEDTRVRLQVFNMKGQVVATLVDAFQPAGRYDLRWDASTALNGSSLPTGIYFYKLETSQYTQIKKMIYTK